MCPVTDPVEAGGRGFPASRGPAIEARDVPAEEEILEEILGSLDERRSRLEAEIPAEAAAAINRVGIDWGRRDYADQLDPEAREALLRAALANPQARAVIDGYIAHLQEHRAEFLTKVLHSTAPPT
jgi:hypothetical protein